ncbi:hypothetical protein FJ417_18645 [Mesorhizobium sp. B3-1-7]|uniref:hypothetical protein n=1 Tax=Mesorhizobium sp. B3-1-7 TaxID=2589894 RepID=UPI0011277789|nr:hypothetical protein [Mesorhizobium sp. B3-1-7]TPI58643.1 hypothetical protein FJ417_18645 [Mesorhizobium sp. B3-1-7]
MSDPRYDKLVELWRAGKIDDEKLKRGLVLLHSISAQADTNPGADFDIDYEPAHSAEAMHWTRWPARFLLPVSWLEGLSPLRRRLIEIGIFTVVAAVVCLAASQLVVLVLVASVDSRSPVNPLGAAAWTAILLVVCGFFVGYHRGAMALMALPIFALLLLSPLWKEKPSVDPKSASTVRTTGTMYTRPVTQEEFGSEWPFPAYRSGVLRCDLATMRGIKRPLVTIELAGKKYGLNGAAQDFGFPDSRSQMAKHPEWGTYEAGASDDMIADALAECG